MTFSNPILWQHQGLGVDKAYAAYIEKKGGYAFFFDPGTGKTLTTIMTLRKIFNEERRIAPTLIFAPIIVLKNWQDEWLKFSRMRKQDVLILDGPVKKRIQKLKSRLEKDSNFIAITNYEGMAKPNREGKQKNQVEFFEAIKSWAPEFLVLDESQRIKTHNSKRTWCITQVAYKARFTLLLTGTPITNDALDIFSQFRAMDKGETFGKSFAVFRSNWFRDFNQGMPRDDYFPDWRIKEGVMKGLNKVIYSKAMRAVKEECLDLPPFIKLKIEVGLSSEQKRLYKEMRDHFITWLEDKRSGENKAVVAQLAITKALRLQQIVSGIVKLEGEDEARILKDTPRDAALRDLLVDIGNCGKVLIWCVFKKNYEQVRKICEKLNLKSVEAHGGISNKAKYAAVDSFNNDPSVRIFIGHPAALGIGINLVPASYSIYYSRNFSLENDIQSEARNYRGGSNIHKKITRYDLVAPETIDSCILEALENKLKVSEEILDWKHKI